MAKQDDFIRTALRVPPDLHKQIHTAASASGRTFNAEIVSRLQASFEQAPLSDRDAELLDGEVGATLKSLNNAMRHIAVLSKRLGQSESLTAIGIPDQRIVQRPARKQPLDDGPKPKITIIRPGIIPPHDPS